MSPQPVACLLHGIFAAVVLGSPEWLWPAVLLGVLVAAAVLFGYAQVMRPWPRKLLLLGLKCLGIVLLTACLLNPLGTQTRVKPGENIVLLVADNSASLQINGKSELQTRGEQLQKLLLEKDAQWQVRLGQDFDLRRYLIDERVTPTEDFTALRFDGAASNLISGLQTLHDRFAGNPLAGIILLSDCNATDAESIGRIADWVPVYCVLPDAVDDPVDLAIGPVAVSKTAFEDAPVTVQAQVQASSDFRDKVYARLVPLDEQSDQQQTSTISLADPSTPAVLRFQLKPKGSRTTFYRLEINDRPAWEETVEAGSQTKEATLANNHRLIAVERDRGPYRVLYVSGRPNWEHKFLGRALSEDTQVNLVSLIRIAKKEAKFDFRGRAGEQGSSLFRGFGDQVDAETNAYDEPVLVRLNTKDDKELAGGFPKTREELYEYHAIILDDIESAFFTSDQLALINRFVAERGGGLLMLGGLDTFRQGDWGKTPLRDALPVYLDRISEAPPQELHLRLTRDGWLQPWVRLRDTEEKEQGRLQKMPSFDVVSTVKSVKPAAQIMAEVEDSGGQRYAALVAQQYGKGHTGAVLIGDMWKWSIQRDADDQDDLAKSWRQTIRWLVSDIPVRIETSYTWITSGQSRGLNLRVSVKDKAFEPQDNAAVHVTIFPPEGDPLTIDAQPSMNEPGLFETVYVPRLAGAYRAEVQVDDAQGLNAGTSEVGWTSDPIAEEFEVTKVNRTLAEEIARRSKGEVLVESQLTDFVARLPYRDFPEQETETYPLWHSPWLLLAALACFALEWGIRRMTGLP